MYHCTIQITIDSKKIVALSEVISSKIGSDGITDDYNTQWPKEI